MTAARPRALFIAGFLSAALGAMLNANAISTLASYTSSADTFTSGMRDSYAAILRAGVDDSHAKEAAANRAEIDAISTRRAEVLWSYRNVLLPLGGTGLIVGTLILLGALRTTWGSDASRAWGRSVWQLGVLVGIPHEVLGALASRAQARAVAERLSDLSSPFAQLLKEAPHTSAPIALNVTLAFFFLAIAGYLSRPAVRRWTEPPPA